ncbi:septum formation protein [Palleronia marisminoris]|uniref:dTTP/UTP pyrophosphatase n=1 Tax=Palleronia marisminoris TaxID=315423 RepID=A0A1Y5TGB1_9RHOB|nr:Maf family protein [Palleronia marisminoris]SFH32328.1 septum formation protein [Palleronia marisminoris]SLN61244.1 Maf-like protein YhdE [Palleronia marisminoris]
MTASPPRLILGSGSPRRLELLAQIGLTPDDIRPPDIDETPRKAELPRPYCLRMATEKAVAVEIGDNEVVLTADTTVARGRTILGKPADADEARAFLRSLSGRRHTVVTAVAVRYRDTMRARDVVTAVRMKRLTEAEIEGYIATGDWQGKAGGYAIQGPASVFIPWISGSFSAVVGLPLAETAALLSATGISPFEAP